MKYIFLTLTLLTVFINTGAAETIQHRLYAVDNGTNQLLYLDQITPDASWTVGIPAGSRDIQILDDNRLLVSHGNGAREYDRTTGAGLEWQVSDYKGIQSARRLSNGDTWLLTNKGLLHIVAADGSKKQTVKIELNGKKNLRLMRLTTGDELNDQTELLIGANTPQAVFRVSTTGEVLQTIALAGKGYKATQLPNGHIYSSTGDEAAVHELDADGNLVKLFGGKVAHPDLGLDFCSGWTPLPNGNMVMTNWLGHGKHGTAAHLVEFTADNQFVWSWEDHEAAQQITNVLVIE